VLAQTRHPGHPAIQALVRWEPEIFLRADAEERSRSGFAPGHPVFRIEGTFDLPEALGQAAPATLLAATSGTGTVCLAAVRPERLAEFRALVLRLASDGHVARVEAEPQL
jgi:primosomal protein N'